MSLKILSHVSIKCLKRRLPGVLVVFFKMNEVKKIVRSFLFTAKFITKHSSERFLSICGQKMSKGFLEFC